VSVVEGRLRRAWLVGESSEWQTPRCGSKQVKLQTSFTNLINKGILRSYEPKNKDCVKGVEGF
jgi:hypothetical protein